MNFCDRGDYVDLLENLVRPLITHYTNEKAGLDVGCTGAYYNKTTVMMEGFSRVLWGLVPAWCGGSDMAPFGEMYKTGFINGTDPNSPAYWGGFHDRDQLFVEMAAIAYGLILVPEYLWEPLSASEQDNLVAWLSSVNDYQLCDNNWQLFGVLVNVALKKLGREYSQDKLDESLEKIESYYRGGGWYTDGNNNRCDYYISFGMHFYCLIYAKVMEDDDKERADVYKKRAVEFAKDFIYWFSDDGSAMPYGRSLTYRFAQCAFWGACVFAGVEPFSLGEMKGIIARHFEDWFSSPILDNGGILTIGYKYPNLHMAESYNAPGSPYWSFKAFIMLALDNDHPFWTADIEPMPKLDDIHYAPYANMIMTRQGDNACLYPCGDYGEYANNHACAKYSKFVYSTKFGFSVPREYLGIHQAAADNVLAFEIDGHVFVRQNPTSFEVLEDRVVSEWSPFVGIVVKTTIIPTKDGHIRRHEINSEYNCKAYDGGFAVYDNRDGNIVTNIGGGYASVTNGKVTCTVEGNGVGRVIEPNPNTNLLVPNTQIPTLEYEIVKGVNTCEMTVTTIV